MKRMLAMLLVLLLPACAGAESIREQIGAPETYQAEYQSNTGLTRISVDAKVIVPDVESVNTYAVSSRDVTAEDAKRMALSAAPGTVWGQDWLRTADWDGGLDDPREVTNPAYGYRFVNYIYALNAAEGTRVGSYNWHMDTAFGEKRLLAQVSYTGQNRYHVNLLMTAELSLAEDETLLGQSATLAQSRAAAEQVAQAMQCGFALEREAKVPDEQETGRYAYWFSFTRQIDGIPVTRTNASSLQDEEEVRNQSYESTPKCEMLTCVVDQGRVVYADLTNPWDIGERRTSDVQLMRFEEIMRIFGTVSPLTIQSQEGDMAYRTYQNAWQITEIRLGYMPVLQRDGGGKWELRPVWDFFGIHTSAFTYDDRPGNVALTIDAIDGTVIDRGYGY